MALTPAPPGHVSTPSCHVLMVSLGCSVWEGAHWSWAWAPRGHDTFLRDFSSCEQLGKGIFNRCGNSTRTGAAAPTAINYNTLAFAIKLPSESDFANALQLVLAIHHIST